VKHKTFWTFVKKARLDLYSSRRVRTGSTRVARYAGNILAILPTTIRRQATPVNVRGSLGRMPKTSEAIQIEDRLSSYALQVLLVPTSRLTHSDTVRTSVIQVLFRPKELVCRGNTLAPPAR
jgi:hypothetical protein